LLNEILGFTHVIDVFFFKLTLKRRKNYDKILRNCRYLRVTPLICRIKTISKAPIRYYTNNNRAFSDSTHLWPDLPLLLKLHKIWSLDSQLLPQTDFEDNMHQNRLRMRLGPRPRWGDYTALPRPPSCIKGGLGLPLREGKGGEGEVNFYNF